MRGTSSKSDWAYVCLGIKARSSKGSKVAVVDLHFDKARGLKPDETADYVCQYDFAGAWTLGQSNKDQDDNVYKKHIKEFLDKAKIGNKPTQKQIGKMLKISDGKVNKLMKDM